MSEIDIGYVAKLARIEIIEEERLQFQSQLGQILTFVDQLNEVDTTEVVPTAHAIALKNVFRQDIPGDSMPLGKVLANAPEQESNQFLVPPVVTGS